MNSWPDAGMTPFRNEKNSNWEGATAFPPWSAGPVQIKPGSVCNEICQSHGLAADHPCGGGEHRTSRRNS